jgi:hypothetical protein
MPRRAILSVAAVVSLLICVPGRTEQAGVQWTTFDGVSIPVPPAEHPRLYLRARDIPDLNRRTTHPVLKPIWDKLQAAAEDDPAGAVEVDAIRYLLTRDTRLGQRTVAATLGLLQQAKFDMSKQDITRPIGRLMVTGAVVYDWCYPVLTADQKRAYLAQFLRLARSLECGYPPPKSHSLTGHYSEWMLMRDMLSAGLAVYDEFPEMYQMAANRFFSVFIPPRNWWYQGHAFHQGSSYAETRVSSELYPLWIFERLGAGPVYHPSLQFVPYQWIYMHRPDGQLLRSGDGQSKSPKLRSLLSASYYKDPYILADYLRDPSIDRRSLLFAFLWRDPDLQPRPVSELPLSRFMGLPYGWMVARTGWDDQSVIAEMKVNVYNFNNHQHLDAGAFQVYYRGPLAIDSGVYEGTTGGYGSPHDVNYNKRTIAHNCLLVYDPAEKFARGKVAMHNDGGQKFPNGWREPRSLEEMLANYRTGEVLGQGFGPDHELPAYTYLKGDISRSYSGKVREAQRSFVFLNLVGQPVRAALIVFDRVVSANPRFRKYWLLHSMEQPRIEGAVITVAPQQRGWQGKLVSEVLLPASAEITAVGGPGKEFWVFGENFPNQPRSGDSQEYEIGQWRIEVSPRDAAETDLFLNAIQVMDRDASPFAVRRIENGDLLGVLLGDTSVLFQRDGRRADRPVTFRSQGTRFLVTDLVEGVWRVWRDGIALGPPVRVAGPEGTLWFEGPPGTYTLRR